LTAKMGLEIQISVLVPLDRGLESWYLGDLGGGGDFTTQFRSQLTGEAKGAVPFMTSEKGLSRDCSATSSPGSYSAFRKTRLERVPVQFISELPTSCSQISTYTLQILPTLVPLQIRPIQTT
jgi:hypothetical protein